MAKPAVDQTLIAEQIKNDARHAFNEAMGFIVKAQSLRLADPTANAKEQATLFAQAVAIFDDDPRIKKTGIPSGLQLEIIKGRGTALYFWAFAAKGAGDVPTAIRLMQRAIAEEDSRNRSGMPTANSGYMLIFLAKWLLINGNPATEALVHIDLALPILLVEAISEGGWKQYLEALQVQLDAYMAGAEYRKGLAVIDVMLAMLDEHPNHMTVTLLHYAQARLLESLDRYSEALQALQDCWAASGRIGPGGQQIGQSMYMQIMTLQNQLVHKLNGQTVVLREGPIRHDPIDLGAAMAHYTKALEQQKAAGRTDVHPVVLDIKLLVLAVNKRLGDTAADAKAAALLDQVRKPSPTACAKEGCKHTATDGAATMSIKCEGCGRAFYCSLGCQRWDWRFRHKDECKLFQRQAAQEKAAQEKAAAAAKAQAAAVAKGNSPNNSPGQAAGNTRGPSPGKQGASQKQGGRGPSPPRR